MTGIDLKSVETLYTTSLMQHGPAPLGVGWKDAESQKLRFDKLVGVVREVHVPFSVNDLGCGYASLYPYMCQLGMQVSHYRGYDISDLMLAEAARHVDHGGELVRGDKLDQLADYSFASGIFNVSIDNDHKKWGEYVRSVILNLAEYSRLGFAFNLLTSYVDYRSDKLYYADPCEYFSFCKERFGLVTLVHDYPLFEWTILVHKG